jgi:hypothetical protein
MTAKLEMTLKHLAVTARRAAQAMLFVLMASMMTPASSADQIYFFVDERGVFHFSNVPVDRRYRPMEELSIGRMEIPGEPSPDEETRVLTWPALEEQVNDTNEEAATSDTGVSPKSSGVRAR